jgi:hypothetical protein
MRHFRRLAVAGLVLFGALAFGAAPALATGYGFTSSFGAEGSGEGQFKEPNGVAISELGATKGDVYVVDKGDNRVEWFNAEGAFQGQFNGSGAPEPLSNPQWVAVDNDPSSASKEDVYVTSEVHVAGKAYDVIDKFSATGVYQGQLTGECEKDNEPAVEPGACPGSASKTVIRFPGLDGVTVDAQGNVWACNGSEGFDINEFSDTGSFDKSFIAPYFIGDGIASDSSGVYVIAPYSDHDVKLGSATGNLLAVFGDGGDALAIDPATNDLFVGHTGSIEQYGPFGEPYETPLDKFGIAHLVGGSAVAVSSTGTVYATDSSNDDVDIFMEGVKEGPLVESESVSGLTSTAATLHARVNPDYEVTSYVLEYAASEAAIGTVGATKLAGMPSSPLPAEGAGIPISAGLSGLEPGHTYYYRVVVENETTALEGKPLDGKTEAFTPYAVPAVTNEEAQDLTSTSAALTGTVNAQGTKTSYYFAYIDQAGYERALAGDAEEKANPYAAGLTTAIESAGSSFAPKAVAPILVAGLLPGETYDYALMATNQFDEQGVGVDATFTTLPGTPPVVSTGPASGVSQNSATLSGTVSTSGLQSEYGFEIGTEPGGYGPATGLGSVGGSLTNTVTLTLGELQPGTTYYYRITASSADGTSYGEPETFTTPGFPELLTAPASLPLIAVPDFAFPTGSLANTGMPTETKTKTLTNAQKLGKALQACHRDKRKARRVSCEKAALKRYGSASKQKGAAKRK